MVLRHSVMLTPIEPSARNEGKVGAGKWLENHKEWQSWQNFGGGSIIQIRILYSRVSIQFKWRGLNIKDGWDMSNSIFVLLKIDFWTPRALRNFRGGIHFHVRFYCKCRHADPSGAFSLTGHMFRVLPLRVMHFSWFFSWFSTIFHDFSMIILWLFDYYSMIYSWLFHYT